MATHFPEDALDEDEEIAAFSENQTNVLFAEWEPMLFNRNRKRAEYAVVCDQ